MQFSHFSTNQLKAAKVVPGILFNSPKSTLLIERLWTVYYMYNCMHAYEEICRDLPRDLSSLRLIAFVSLHGSVSWIVYTSHV